MNEPKEGSEIDIKVAPEISANSDWDDFLDSQKMAVFSDWRKTAEAYENWGRQMDLCYEYMESNQIPPSLRSRDPRSLYLCLNMIRNRIGPKVGIITAEKPTPMFEGREGVDETGAAALEHIFNFTISDPETMLHALNRGCARDMLVCGIGAIREYFNPDRPVDVEGGQTAFGDVAARRVDPKNLRIDPAMRMNNVSRIRWIFEIIETPMDELRIKYGEKVAEVQGKPVNLSGEQPSRLRNYGDRAGETDTSGNKLKYSPTGSSGKTDFNRIAEVVECWYKFPKASKKTFKRVKSETEGAEDTWESAGLTDEADAEKDESGDYREINKIKWEVRKAVMVEDILLEDDVDETFDDLPYALYLGEEIHDYPYPVGEVYHLLHPQDLMNALITSVVDNAVRTNNTGWKYEDGALSHDQEELLIAQGSSPGFRLKVRQGYFDRVQRLEPGRMSDALYQIWNDIRVLMDELAASYQVQRGGMPYDTSGRGIIALQQSADMSAAGWHIAVEDALTRWGKLRMRNIQKNYKWPRALRITGDLGTAKTMYLVDTPEGIGVKASPEAPSGPETMGLPAMPGQPPPKGAPSGNEKAIEGKVLLSDLSTAKFDLIVKIKSAADEAPSDKLDKAKFLFEAGVVDKEYLARMPEFGVKDASAVLKRMDEQDKAKQLAEQVLAAQKVVPEIMEMLQDPKLLQEMMAKANPPPPPAPPQPTPVTVVPPAGPEMAAMPPPPPEAPMLPPGAPPPQGV